MLKLTYSEDDIRERIREGLSNIVDDLPKKEYLIRIDSLAQNIESIKEVPELENDLDAIELDFRVVLPEEKKIMNFVDSVIEESGLEPDVKKRQDVLNALKILNGRVDEVKPRSMVLEGFYREVLNKAKRTPYTDVVLRLSEEEIFSEIKGELFKENGLYTLKTDRDGFERYVLMRHYRELMSDFENTNDDIESIELVNKFILNMNADLRSENEKSDKIPQNKDNIITDDITKSTEMEKWIKTYTQELEQKKVTEIFIKPLANFVKFVARHNFDKNHRKTLLRLGSEETINLFENCSKTIDIYTLRIYSEYFVDIIARSTLFETNDYYSKIVSLLNNYIETMNSTPIPENVSELLEFFAEESINLINNEINRDTEFLLNRYRKAVEQRSISQKFLELLEIYVKKSKDEMKKDIDYYLRNSSFKRIKENAEQLLSASSDKEIKYLGSAVIADIIRNSVVLYDIHTNYGFKRLGSNETINLLKTYTHALKQKIISENVLEPLFKIIVNGAKHETINKYDNTISLLTNCLECIKKQKLPERFMEDLSHNIENKIKRKIKYDYSKTISLISKYLGYLEYGSITYVAMDLLVKYIGTYAITKKDDKYRNIIEYLNSNEAKELLRYYSQILKHNLVSYDTIRVLSEAIRDSIPYKTNEQSNNRLSLLNHWNLL